MGVRRGAEGRHYASSVSREGLRAALLRRSSEVFFLLVQQVSDAHEVVCKHSGADQHLKALRSLGARQRFMPRPRKSTDMRPSMPARKRCPFLNSGLFSSASRLELLFPPHCGMQTSFTVPSWHALMFSSLKKPRSPLYQSGAKPKVS